MSALITGAYIFLEGSTALFVAEYTFIVLLFLKEMSHHLNNILCLGFFTFSLLPGHFNSSLTF